MSEISQEARRITEALAAPFPAEMIGFKPQSISGSRCLAVPYIDARDVMDRLDEALGPGGWEDSYEVLLDGNVVCRLRCRLGGEWLTKCDVGGESEQKDEGDRRKAAFSDALKRAAVKWGVGRYIYRLPSFWADYNAQTRQIVNPPRLPDWALPQAAPRPQAPARPAPQASGPSLVQRVIAAEDAAVKEGLCGPAQLQNAIHGALRGEFGDDVAAYPEAKVREFLKGWFEDARSRLPATPEQTRAIDAALARTGETWPRCCKKLKVPARTGLPEITRGQAAELLKALEQLPDAKAA